MFVTKSTRANVQKWKAKNVSVLFPDFPQYSEPFVSMIYLFILVGRFFVTNNTLIQTTYNPVNLANFGTEQVSFYINVFYANLNSYKDVLLILTKKSVEIHILRIV